MKFAEYREYPNVLHAARNYTSPVSTGVTRPRLPS
jgi:hypothetical protein